MLSVASLVAAIPDGFDEEGGREVWQNNVRAVVRMESRAAEPDLLPGQVPQGGEVAPLPADVVAVEQPSQGSELLLVHFVRLQGQQTQVMVTESYKIRYRGNSV